MDLFNYDDEMICPICHGIGRVLKRNKRVSDLTVEEYKALWIECYEEMEKHKLTRLEGESNV